MKILNLYIILLLFSVKIIFAGEIPDYLQPEYQVFEKENYSCFHKEFKHDMILKDYIPVTKRNYDVLSYDLYMDWYDLLSKNNINSEVNFKGTNKIKIRIDTAKLSQLVFDSYFLKIDSILVDGKLHTDYNQSFIFLTLDFSEDLVLDQELTVEIYYTYKTSDKTGIIFFDKGEYIDVGPPPNHDSIFTEERIAYTMSEPVDARKWMPCNDNPYDKAITSMTVKVPNGFVVAGNGILDKTITIEDSTTYFWIHKHPISTYLMSATASKYKYYFDWYKRVSNPKDSIKVEYYVWQRDYDDTTSDGLTYNATYAFRNSVRMLEYYSTIFGEYPYEKYGMTAVQNAWFGGMEHQTITTLNRSVLRKNNKWGWNNDKGNQLVMAHELAHQWLGDKITCASWNDIWINEGGATWAEALWDGRNDESYYYGLLLNRSNSYFYYNNIEDQFPIYAPPLSDVFNYATTYCKAGFFYHMLSEMIGRENFLSIMREMLSDFAYKPIDTEQFKNYLISKVENPLIDFDTFFDQWIYKAGHPVFDIKLSAVKNEFTDLYDLTIDLVQMQEGDDIPLAFKTPLTLKLYASDGQVFENKLIVNNRIQQFNIPMAVMIDSVKIDSSKTLCETYELILSVKEIEHADNSNNYVIYPCPVPPGQNAKININLDASKDISIDVFDNLGIFVQNSYSGYLPEGNYEFTIDTKDLSQGAYFVKIKSGENYIFKKFTKVR